MGMQLHNDMFSKLLFNPTKPSMQEYFVAIIRVEEDDVLSNNYQETIRECFSIIRKHGGDVNQFNERNNSL
jgi:hypothetical protein